MSRFSKNPLAPPLQAVQSAMGADPRLMQKTSTFMYANDGPAVVAVNIMGVMEGEKRKDDAPYFTNNEGIPWPDAAHSKNVCGIPLEWFIQLVLGAFGYFEATMDMTYLTKVDSSLVVRYTLGILKW
ncbi:hypothetical protein K440DRAFT_644645 [Wilcoxina mikolae CBS 423.85]|nr:hypothetical protein K440DRAFT_644645 [Wilcoxina mikolae CBS 423.85]